MPSRMVVSVSLGGTLLMAVTMILMCSTFASARPQVITQEKLTKEKALALGWKENGKAARSCPGNCNGHGQCVNNQCECFFGYAGNDCSIEETALTSGTYVSGSVTAGVWNYYYLSLHQKANLIVEVNQTSAGDVDLFVRNNDFPTLSNYDKKDESTSSYVRLVLEDADAGTWYFGLFGFSGPISYKIRATAAGTCLNQCSGHGSCLSGNCHCNPGYVGLDCSVAVIPLAPDAPAVSGSVATGAWHYYSFQFPPTSSSADQFTVKMLQTDHGDCDVYARFNDPPTVFEYDYVNVTVHNTSTIVAPTPSHGTWFIGVRGFSAGAYTLQVLTNDDCPNDCTHRGSCNSEFVCTCNPGYTGTYCETRQSPLTNNQQEDGYVSYDSWNYYTYQTNTINNFVIEVDQEGTGGDCDIYVKYGGQPTRTSFDYANTGVQVHSEVDIPDPGQGTWNIGIFGWSECTYTITCSETSVCPSNCNNRGTCTSDGVCLCQAGYTGEGCEYSLVPLYSNVIQQGTLDMGEWKYYRFMASNTSSIHIAAKEINTSGWLWMYVAKDFPTLQNYQYSDVETNTNTHHINIDLSTDENESFIIGVFSDPYALDNPPMQYQIIAWAASF